MAGSSTADAPFPFAGGAHFINGSYRSFRTERAHILRYRKCFLFLFSFYGILLHWRLHFSFWPAKIEKRSKEKKLPPTSAPKCCPAPAVPGRSFTANAPAREYRFCTTVGALKGHKKTDCRKTVSFFTVTYSDRAVYADQRPRIPKNT